jgi:hypothetical protein
VKRTYACPRWTVTRENRWGLGLVWMVRQGNILHAAYIRGEDLMKDWADWMSHERKSCAAPTIQELSGGS